ncbi:MAG: general secretion pathway protein GspK [Verrucomicrobiae bacterium]|nr:general secretion pathway protein GspK [Verrucomicrobiae bacterium]
MTRFRPTHPDHRLRSRRASALIAVYWLIAILSLAVFTATQFLMFEMQSHASSEWEFRAEQFADMGIALAAHPGVERWDPILRQRIDQTGGFEARIRSEGARLNPNFLVLSQPGRVVLARLFTHWGLSEFDSLALTAALVDWTDADDDESPQGAESVVYRGAGFRDMPYNRPFRALDELELVRGFDEVMARRPDWRIWFTILSAGPLDLNDAPPELIQEVCDCGADAALRLVAVRAGADRVTDTEDDQRFESAAEAFNLLALGVARQQALANLVTVDDSATRLISVGTAGKVSVERTFVIQGRTEQPVLLEVQTRVLR